MKLNSNDVEIPASSVGVYDAIFRRRSVKQFTPDPVSRETLERLFSAAVWAPNHRLTDPTRFFAVGKDSPMRRRVAEAAWQSTYDGVVNPNPEHKRRSADASRDRVLNAPAMVYVYSLPGDNDEVTRGELRHLLLRRAEHGPGRGCRGPVHGLEHRGPHQDTRPGGYPGRRRGLGHGWGGVPGQGRGGPDDPAHAPLAGGHVAGVTS